MNNARKKVKGLLAGVAVAVLFFNAVPEAMPVSQNVSQVQAASVKISAKKVTLFKGQSKTLKVNGTKGKVSWTTNKSKVASVNKKGKVTGHSKGKAVITAKVNGKRYTSNITVETPSLNLKSSTLNIGESCNLKLNGTKQKVTWSSSKNTVANVTKKGKVTAKKSGNTTITAKVAGKKYYCKITVKTKAPSIVNVSSVQLNQSNLLLKEGDTTKLTATVYPQNANNKGLIWASSNQGIISVDSNGNVRAIAAGTAVVTVKTVDGGYVASCTFTVQRRINIAQNHTILKNYILTYGGMNSSGNRFIKYVDPLSGYTFAIVYEGDYDKFDFIGVLRDDESNASFSMNVETVRSNIVRPEFIFVFNDYYAGFEASAEFNASAYTKNSDVYFILKSSLGGFTQSGIQDLANTGLRLSFTNWDYLLRSQVGLSMMDIGFLSYQ